MQTTQDPIIRVQHMTAGFEGSVVIDDISFEVYRGEVFVILGGSGSGKSTLLKHMIGLHQPVTGRILIQDEDIVTAEGEQRTKILRNIGVMYQMGALFGSMTLLENVRLPLEEFTDLPRRGDESHRADEVEIGGVGRLHGLHALRDQRRHAKAGGDCARDGTGTGDSLSR